MSSWSTTASNWQRDHGWVNDPLLYSNNVNGTGIGNQVFFDDTATGTHNIIIAPNGGVTPDNLNVSTATGYTFSGGAISGPANLTINVGGNTGAVTLNNVNTFTGATNLDSVAR